MLLVLDGGTVLGSAPVTDFADPSDGGLREEAVTCWLTTSGAFKAHVSGHGRPGEDVQGGASDSVRSGMQHARMATLVVPGAVLMH